MNCKKIIKLIPLLVEADLETFEIEQLSAHFATCESCRKTAKEFQASQSMLHNFAAPEFDEDVFAQVRSSVLNEIARPKNTVSIRPIWNWETAFAASLVLVFLLSGIAMYRHGNHEKYVAQASNIDEVETINFSSAKVKNSTSALPVVKLIPKPRSGRNAIAQGEASVSKGNPGSVSINCINPEKAREIDREETSVVINISTLASPASAAILNAEKPTSEPEMLYIEMQTADPNIRIIWLTPKEISTYDTKSDFR